MVRDKYYLSDNFKHISKWASGHDRYQGSNASVHVAQIAPQNWRNAKFFLKAKKLGNGTALTIRSNRFVNHLRLGTNTKNVRNRPRSRISVVLSERRFIATKHFMCHISNPQVKLGLRPTLQMLCGNKANF